MTRARRECDQVIALLEASSEIRDRHPKRCEVDNLTHGLQMADRARAAGYDDQWVVVCMVHDAAKSLTEIYHGEAIAEITREYVGELGAVYLRGHSFQAYGLEQSKLGLLDASSFDPLYPTPTLDEMVPYLERLYGVA